MKKFLTILVVALVAMTCVFAIDASKISVGVSAGFAEDTVIALGRGEYNKVRADAYGFDLAVRGDYALTDDSAVTAVFNWNILMKMVLSEKTDFFALYRSQKFDNADVHYLGLAVGYTKAFKVTDAIKIAVTAGPEIKLSCDDGKADVGLKGIIKASYAFASVPVTVDFSLAGSSYFVKDGKWYHDYHTDDFRTYFINDTITVGATYQF